MAWARAAQCLTVEADWGVRRGRAGAWCGLGEECLQRIRDEVGYRVEHLVAVSGHDGYARVWQDRGQRARHLARPGRAGSAQQEMHRGGDVAGQGGQVNGLQKPALAPEGSR